MPKPIIKRNAVRFESANLEEFSLGPRSVIPSKSVDLIEEDENKNLHPRKRSIIPGSDVRVQSQSIEICHFDFTAPQEESLQIAEPEQTQEANKDDSIDSEQLEQFRLQLEQEWAEKLAAAVDGAKEAAFEEGYARAKETFEKKAENSKREFEKGLDRIKESWENYLKRSETILMQIALEITQFVIDIPLPKQYTDITERVLNNALDQLGRETPLSLSLNPLDLLRLQESGMMDVIKDKFPALRWDPQPTLKEGNWIIQTPKQAIRRISDELLHHLKDQFGLVEHGQTDIEVHSTLPGYEIEYIPPVTNVAVSTTPVPLTEQNHISGPVPTTTPIQFDHEQIKNVVFSPATSTTSHSSAPIPDLTDLPESDSDS